MRIQHNIMAMNAYRNYNNNTSALSKNLEKLSSGYKINRAGDDAAGLAISEKMRAQITGLEGAQKNAKDGISLVQTAEGALTEVHDMLNRMYSLAEQSANGTYEDETDRAQLQKEVTQLKAEINRIADSTNFNGIQLLDGSLSTEGTTNVQAGENSEMVSIALDSITADKSFSEAESAKWTFTAGGGASALTAGTGNFDAYSITFKDENGREWTLNLVETTAGAIGGTGVSDLVTALKEAGKEGGLSIGLVGKDQAEALEAFQKTFTVSADGNNNLVFETSNATGKGELISIAHTANASMDAAITALDSPDLESVDVDIEVEALEGGLRFDFEGTAGNAVASAFKNGSTFTIGDKVYEFVDSMSEKLDNEGATAVLLGTSVGDAVKNLAGQLASDGFDVQISDAEESVLVFTNPDQVEKQQDQSGVQISGIGDKFAVVGEAAVKQEYEISVGATITAGEQAVTINFADENGQLQKTEIKFNATGTQADDAKALYNAMMSDSDLMDNFNIKLDTTNNKVILTSRSEDPQKSSIQKIEATNSNITSGEIQEAASGGKTLGVTAELKNGDTITINGKTYEFSDGSTDVGEGNVRVAIGNDAQTSLKNLAAALEKDGVKATWDADKGGLFFSGADEVTTTTGGLTLQIGDTSDSFNQLTVSIEDCHTVSLGIDKLDIGDQKGAQAALETIEKAINYVSDVRGTLGATQNRLDHTINNLSVMQENIQDAESSIRDTDVADEMMEYTKNNILIQSAQAMLAQANQVPQGVLQLLQ